MKHSIKEYAIALAEVLAESHKSNRAQTAERFLHLLIENGDWQKAEKIITLTQELLLKKSGGRKIVVETARSVPIEKIIDRFAAKKDAVEQKVTPALVAGVRITVNGEQQLDLSFIRLIQSVFIGYE